MKTSTKIICILALSLGLGNVNAQSSTFYYTGATQTFAVPSCVTQVTVQLWSAGGGGGSYNSPTHYYLGGGSGAYYSGVLSGISPGQILTLTVPSAGLYSNITSGGAGGWPGGGKGGNDATYGEYGGGGGGYAAIQVGSTYYVIAGAGGGGGSYPYVFYQCYGGGGGATSGLSGGGGYASYGGGNGGTLASGGTQGYSFNTCDSGGVGRYLTGGKGGGTTCSGWYGGGGGGSGYYGGGGGGDDASGGGGGSSYPGSIFTFRGITFTPISNLQGSNGSSSDSVFAPASPPVGIGTGGFYAKGGNGMITISWLAGVVTVTDTAETVNQVTCFGVSDGMAYAKVTGGTASTYTYSWSPSGETTDTATYLSAGNYTVTVNNTCGSTATAAVTITQPTALNVTGNVITNVSCYQSNNAAASAITSGGISPYTYLWTGGGGTNSVATGLSAGIYRVTVIDNNGCIAFASVSITQPDVLTAGTNVTSNASCGISNGSATSTVGGGTLPYTYSWTDGETTASVSGLSGGTYTLNVTDNNGCRASSSIITISETPAVFASAATNANIICYGDNVGLVSCRVNGGTLPYSYLWSPGGNTDYSVANLSGGTYTITVTDANGCISSASTTITQPSPITIVKDSTADLKACTGSAWVVVNGGIPPYTYLWSPGGNTSYYLYDQCGGTYCCTVTDGQGCTKSVCIRVTSPTGIDNVADNSGSVTVYPNPNNGEFTIESTVVSSQWSVEVYNILGEKVYSQLSTQNSQLTINISNQPNGVYLYRVLTENGNLLGEGKIIIQK